MAETIQDEQLAEPQELTAEPQEFTEGMPLDVAEEMPLELMEELPKETPKPHKRHNLTLPLLTILLVLVGICEAVFWGYYGFSVYARSLARERYEQEQKALEEERAARGVRGGSSYSPNMKVENGAITWEREKREYAGTSRPANTSTPPQREDGLRLSRLPTIKVHYGLAEMDTDEGLPATQPKTGLTDNATPPTIT